MDGGEYLRVVTAGSREDLSRWQGHTCCLALPDFNAHSMSGALR